jgi:hypothetical protein
MVQAFYGFFSEIIITKAVGYSTVLKSYALANHGYV